MLRQHWGKAEQCSTGAGQDGAGDGIPCWRPREQLGHLPWNIPGHKSAGQVSGEPAAAAQQLTATPGIVWISGTVRCQLPNCSRCLLSGKALYIVHGKEESVIHTSWTISTFSSLPDHPPPSPHMQKGKKFLCGCGRGGDVLRRAHVELCGLCTASLSTGSWKQDVICTLTAPDLTFAAIATCKRGC